MRSTFSILPYINRNKVKADGTTSVMCRISIDGKSSVFSTGIYCRPEDWNTEKGEIREQRANNRLIELRNKLEQTYEKYLKTKGVVSAELLKMRLHRPIQCRNTFFRPEKRNVNGSESVQLKSGLPPVTGSLKVHRLTYANICSH